MVNQDWKRCIAMFIGALFIHLSVFSVAVSAADTIEFMTGAKLDGKVTSIRKPKGEFDFESKIGRRTVRKTYQFADVHAVILNGTRHILTPKKAGNGDAEEVKTRTAQEIRQLLEAEGASDPAWMEKTRIAPPKTLNLAWPLKPSNKGWNNKVNVGQYIWDIVNPNPNRWRQGIKIVKQVLDSHENEPALLQRDRQKLGMMYFQLLQDYPRAAYWLEQAKVSGQTGAGVTLAECYWRLGNRDMAKKMLTQRALPPGAIKLLAELGEIETAQRLAEAYAGTQAEPNAFLLIADAFRGLGNDDLAIKYYERVVNSDKARDEEYRKRFVGRAEDSIEAIGLADKADVAKVANGKYREASVGYNGPVEVEVVVSNKKIDSVRVISHKEKQFYSSIRDTPKQIVAKQSVHGIDGFSGATITSAAIVNASAKALAKGAR